jgi:hypothetical protein
MRNVFVWVVKSPVRLVEIFFGAFLLLAAFLFSEDGPPPGFLYGLGTLLPFLTLYAYPEQGGADDAR